MASNKLGTLFLTNDSKRLVFTQTTSDPCIYVKRGNESTYIGVYVDDILLCGRSKEQIKEVKLALAEKFDVKDLGDLTYFLGGKNRAGSQSRNNLDWSAKLYGKQS